MTKAEVETRIRDGDAEFERHLAVEQVLNIHRTVPFTSLGMAICAAVVAANLRDKMDPLLLWPLVGSIAAGVATRLATWWRLEGRPKPTAVSPGAIRRIVVWTAVFGAIWSVLTISAYLAGDTADRFVILYTVGGLAAVCTAMQFYVPAAVVAWIVVSMSPMIAAVVYDPGVLADAGTTVSFLLLVLAIALGAAVVIGYAGFKNGVRLLVDNIRQLQHIERAEGELRQSEERFRDLAESTSDWFWEQDENLRFSYLSPATDAISAFPPAEMIGKTRRESLPLGISDAQWKEHDRILAARLPFRDFRYDRIDPAGRLRHLKISGRPVFAADGRFLGYRGAGSDVTEETIALRAIQEARAVAETASRMKSAFLANLSHELRTPLNAVIGFSELLLTDQNVPYTAEQRRMLEMIDRSGRLLLSLISDLLDLSRIEAGTMALSPVAVDVAELVAEASIGLDHEAKTRGVTLDIRPVEGEPLAVIADRVRFVQVLFNLGSNAIKYNRPEGRVVIRAARTNDKVRVSVEDTGQGIPKSRHADLFQPFRRLGREAGSIEGTGIGLTISLRLAELMGGTIGFQSEEGVGSIFWLDLPAK